MINEYSGLVFLPPEGIPGVPIDGLAYLDATYSIRPADPELCVETQSRLCSAAGPCTDKQQRL